VKRLYFLIPVVTFLVLTVMFYQSLFQGPPSELPSPLVGKTAPDIPLPALDEKSPGFARSELGQGKPIIVNFWASWCGPCVEEMPELVALSHQYKQTGIRFIGIGVDSEQNVKNFLQKVKVDYPVFVSGYAGADLARNFGNTAGALPFTVVIDETGKIRETKLGQIQPAELKKTLDAL